MTAIGSSPGSPQIFVPASTPLIGLNYFDGRFLRADDLNLERQAQRAYAEYSNRAGGPGLVYGFDLARHGTRLSLSAGLAVDPTGRLLYLPDGVDAEIPDLIRASQPPGGATAQGAAASPAGFGPCEQPAAGASAPLAGGSELYLVCLSQAQQLCGQSEVLGRICDDACVTATDRPYLVDGVTLSLVPLKLHHPLPTLPGLTTPEIHLRSQVASAFFADEWDQGGSLLSASGLHAPVWCAGSTAAGAGDTVPVGVLGWDGSAVTFLDEWIARRERIETPPRVYWSGRMELRPWPVFLAQVLQFQCQLADLGVALPGPGAPPAAWTQILPKAGFVTVPSAGYLAVDPGSGITVRRQCQALLGDGVELRFCAVRRDQIAHELERAQHMNRISLIQGMRNQADREQVDILVPDGVLEADTAARTDYGFAVDLAVGPGAGGGIAKPQAAALSRLLLHGVGRVNLDSGITVRAAVAGSAQDTVAGLARLIADLAASGPSWDELLDRVHALQFGTGAGSILLLRAIANLVVSRAIAHRTAGEHGGVIDVAQANGEVAALSVSWWLGRDPFTMPDHTSTPFHLGFDLIVPAESTLSVTFVVDGRLQRVPGRTAAAGDEVRISVTGFAEASMTGGPAASRAGSFARTLVLTRDQQHGRTMLGLSDDRQAWMIGVGWQGDPVEASGALVQMTGIRDGRPAPDDAGADPSAQSLGGMSARPLPLPRGTRVVAAFEAAENTAISQPGDPHRESAIAALQILSGLYPDDAGYVDQAYGELFPAAAAARSRVRPVTDWVLFRRRRREDCEGDVGPALPGTSKLAAWVARADSIDQAKSAADALFGGADPGVTWKATAGDFLEFEAGTATLLTPPSEWRGRYQTAGGGSMVFAAGYAAGPGGSDAPVGIGRARALVDACPPVARLDPQGRVDLVTTPPADQMLAGTDGSIFLISYQPDLVEVITVDAADTNNETLVAAIDPTPDAVTVAAASAAAMPVLDTVDVTIRTDDWAARLPTELAQRKADLVAVHNTDLDWTAVVWMHQDLTGQRGQQSEDHVNQVLTALGVADVPAVPRHVVDFDLGNRPPVRIYLLFRIPIPQVG
jgi:hypothetical protein